MENKEQKMDFELENELEPSNIIPLCDEDGNEMEFELVDAVEYEGKDYVLLLPTEEESEEVVILQSIPDPEDEEMVDYITIEDEDLLQAVFEQFKERLQNEFDFE